MPDGSAAAPTAGRRSRLRKRIGLWVLASAIAAVTAFLVWCSILYPASADELAAVTDDPAIASTETPVSIVFEPVDGGTGVGLLFIPGAKVQPEAYAGKLRGLVDAGTTVVITKPILNLAFFDYRPLTAFLDTAPDVDTWYVGGHSLGGVKACQFASEPAVSGLVLFGSYCAEDLSGADDSGADLRVLSIGGSEDGLTTPADIRDNAGRLPADTEFAEIDGMNHAQFGDYGPQPGDGTATRSDAEVRSELTRLLTAFVTAR